MSFVCCVQNKIKNTHHARRFEGSVTRFRVADERPRAVVAALGVVALEMAGGVGHVRGAQVVAVDVGSHLLMREDGVHPAAAERVAGKQRAPADLEPERASEGA